MKIIGMVSWILLISIQSGAQEFRYGEMEIEKPEQVILSNFTGLSLPMEDGTPNANRYNPVNPYTYLQMILNERNNLYQLLIQTDFWGRIIYVGYSNNLAFAFDGRKRPLPVFYQCIKQVNTQFGTAQKIQRLLSCILGLLNHVPAS